MFTSRRVTRTIALAGAAAAVAATSAAAAPLHEPGQTRSASHGADVDRSLAAEQYYSSYGRPGPIARPQPTRARYPRALADELGALPE